MREVELQSMIVDLVRSRGGYADKRANKFKVGVSDLLVKLPTYPAFIAEVKQRFMQAAVREFQLNDVTALQKADLRNAQKAGMNAGVISFLQTKYGKRSLRVASFMVSWLDERNYWVAAEDHHFIGNPKTRDAVLWDELTELARGLHGRL